jgi:ABC-2 type transport system permease protein
MTKILVVVRHEFATLVGKWSFWFGLIGVPLFMGAIMFVTIFASGVATASAISAQEDRSHTLGYVDLSGLIRSLPTGNPLQAFPDEASAKAALEADQLAGYFVVPADYLDTGKVALVSKQFTPMNSPTGAFEQAMRYNLLNGDPQAVLRVSTPVNLYTIEALAPKDAKGGSGAPFPVLPIAAAMMFSIVLVTASSYLMQSVTTEKENRVMEVLMSSMTPTQLLAGKVLGLGLVGLVQMALWLGSALGALNFIPAGVSLGVVTVEAVVVGLAFFLLGYFIYASLMAGLGALMPGSREAAQYTFFIILPMFVPLYLNTAIALEPDGPLATALSIIPFTSPVAMVMRMVSTDVPAWQIALALALSAVTVAAVIWVVSRIFRAQSLLSGSKPTVREIVAALR